MSKMKLEIITPNGAIFSGNVKTVTLPGSEGEFGVLAQHAGTVTLLSAGAIEIEKEDGSKELVAINWGHAKVDEKSVTVLADGAVAISGEGSDIAKSIQEAKDLVSSMSDSDIVIAAASAKIEATARLH
jgi:F-type H+-transporting ATPase subunit epsilon